MEIIHPKYYLYLYGRRTARFHFHVSKYFAGCLTEGNSSMRQYYIIITYLYCYTRHRCSAIE